jgi:hypothetical protein
VYEDDEEEDEVHDRSQQLQASSYNKVSPGKSQRATIDVLGYAPTNTYIS